MPTLSVTSCDSCYVQISDICTFLLSLFLIFFICVYCIFFHSFSTSNSCVLSTRSQVHCFLFFNYSVYHMHYITHIIHVIHTAHTIIHLSITLTSLSLAHECLELTSWDWLTYQVTPLVENGFLSSRITITHSSLLRTVTPREVPHPHWHGSSWYHFISVLLLILNMAALFTFL